MTFDPPKVLVIDDMPERRPLLERVGLPVEADWSLTGDDVEDLHAYDEVWLDHDLGLNTKATGSYWLTKMLEGREREDRPMPYIRIHTLNPAGRDSMILTCERWGIEHEVVDWLFS